MNPGLVVKLRPSGPWRIGPDSGARNRVDVIYHSDSLFSAVTSAMARLGRLEGWLDATARSATPAVCFSSCFPFLDGIGFVVPPRTVWPPASPALMAAHVRWKSARFVPLEVVQAILAGEAMDENRWSVDGPSGCLVPVGKAGPFRTSVRWNAAVDRLTGTSERHSMACIEFRPGAGLWAVAGFSGEAARDAWQDAVKAAFRLLADTGFGGERSRGWGRSEAPEFIEGELPGMILGETRPQSGAGLPAGQLTVESPEPERPAEVAVEAPPDVILETPAAESSAVAEVAAPPAIEPLNQDRADGDVPADSSEPAQPADETAAPGDEAAEAAPAIAEAEAALEAASGHASADPEAAQPVAPEPVIPEVAPASPASPAPAAGNAHWLLSLFVPAEADAVDWTRGSYTVMARGGRVESPSGSGGLKKQIQMIAEGSVVVAGNSLRGAAPDVAPDGFAHPVFRAGFALSIPLPEGN